MTQSPLAIFALVLSLTLSAMSPRAIAQDDTQPNQPTTQETGQETDQETGQDSAQDPAASTEDTQEADQAPESQPVIQSPRFVARLVESSDFTPLISPDALELQFDQVGAGISKLVLLDEYETVALEHNVAVQERTTNANGIAAVPFALLGVTIDGSIANTSGQVWSEIAPGHFEATIEDDQGIAIITVTRKFSFRDNAHGFVIDQSVENLTDQPHQVSFFNTAMIDMPKDKNGYSGDRRRVRYGTLRSPEKQGASIKVHVDDDLHSRNKLLGKRAKDSNGNKRYPDEFTVFPNDKSIKAGNRLSWISFNDRYFAVTMHPILDPTSSTPDHRLISPSIDRINRLVLNPYAQAIDTTMVLSTTSETFTLAPRATKSHAVGIYAGPRTKPIFEADPLLAALNLPDMVVYNIGGFCAGCTFDWLTNILISVLRIFHSIVQDWAVSILLLVVLVRGCLHPITRWSQIRMQRFAVQMQELGPKQKALREKFKDDPKRMQQEMSKLWREEGISPLGMLGCLPMLLQSPVWIALYATLFFAVELKHEPAFYGLFQNLTGGAWMFMADLSAADGAIPLPSSMHFSFPLWGTVSSINILPLLLGVVFFLHQKYLTPPTQSTLTPEQESQQKMMKVMMVVMFPIMMYTAPSGLALYFITNSTMGILENKWIRAHMKKHGMLDIENIRAEKQAKGPGFMQRMQDAAEAQRQIAEKGPQQPNPASKQNRYRNK